MDVQPAHLNRDSLRDSFKGFVALEIIFYLSFGSFNKQHHLSLIKWVVTSHWRPNPLGLKDFRLEWTGRGRERERERERERKKESEREKERKRERERAREREREREREWASEKESERESKRERCMSPYLRVRKYTHRWSQHQWHCCRHLWAMCTSTIVVTRF